MKKRNGWPDDREAKSRGRYKMHICTFKLLFYSTYFKYDGDFSFHYSHSFFDSNIYLLSARLGRNLSLRIIEYVLLFIKTLVRFVRLCSPYFDYYLDGMVYGLILHKS